MYEIWPIKTLISFKKATSTPAIHMMVGYPGSGKSEYAAELAKRIGAKIVSLDKIREQLYGDASIQGPWDEIGPEYYKQLNAELNAGKPVIIDNTNMTPRDRKIIKEYDVPAYAYVMDTTWDQAARNNLIRGYNGGRQVDKGYMDYVRNSPYIKPISEDEGFAGVTHIPWVSPGPEYDELGDKLFKETYDSEDNSENDES